MAIVKRRFHQQEHGTGNEDVFYLARDTATGRVFVCREWSRRRSEGAAPGGAHIELDAFLAEHGTAQDRLLQMIGTLVEGQ